MNEESTIGPLGRWLAVVIGRVDSLPRKSHAVLFAYLAEKMFPLYERFCEVADWDASRELRMCLDSAWHALLRPTPLNARKAAIDIQRLAPDGELYDAPGSTFAQDVVICVDEAWSALSGGILRSSRIEFGLEAVSLKASVAVSLDYSVEGARRVAWEHELHRLTFVADFVSEVNTIVDMLASGPDASLIEAIRARALAVPVGP